MKKKNLLITLLYLLHLVGTALHAWYADATAIGGFIDTNWLFLFSFEYLYTLPLVTGVFALLYAVIGFCTDRRNKLAHNLLCCLLGLALLVLYILFFADVYAYSETLFISVCALALAVWLTWSVAFLYRKFWAKGKE